jgi:hypothetical protein
MIAGSVTFTKRARECLSLKAEIEGFVLKIPDGDPSVTLFD